jgi:Restriction endonuclease
MYIDACQRALLGLLYGRFLHRVHPEGRNLHIATWLKDGGFGRDIARGGLRQLVGQGLVVAAGEYAFLSADGVLFVEKRALFDSAAISASRQARIRILRALADNARRYGPNAELSTAEVVAAAGISDEELRSQEFVFGPVGLGLTAMRRSGSYGISEEGVDELVHLDAQQALIDEFVRLKSGGRMTPQQRGHRLEELLQKVIEAAGWECERNILTPGEEHDLMVSDQREHYLVSCKWEKKRVGPKHVRDLVARLTKRVAVSGLLFSMSGFTDNAVGEARDQLGHRLVLLFGPNDTEALVRGERFFTELLTERHNRAALRREIVFDEGLEPVRGADAPARRRRSKRARAAGAA